VLTFRGLQLFVRLPLLKNAIIKIIIISLKISGMEKEYYCFCKNAKKIDLKRELYI